MLQFLYSVRLFDLALVIGAVALIVGLGIVLRGRGFYSSVWTHLKSWPETYVMLPLVILAIPGSALLAFYITGHAPKENVTWLVDLAERALVASLIVIYISFTRQTSGIWMTKQEQFEHPYLATLQMLMKLACLGAFLWLFTH